MNGTDQDDDPMSDLLLRHPDVPWWTVIWKGFVSLFVIGVWVMTYLMSLLMGIGFGPGLTTPSDVGKLIIFRFLNVIPAWAIWALSVSLSGLRTAVPRSELGWRLVCACVSHRYVPWQGGI